MSIDLDPAATGLEGLAGICDGPVLGPRDGGYAEACACWNVAWTHRPAIVVRAANVNDVIRAVRHAVDRGLAIAVQGTGHGVTVPADERSLLVVTTDLDQLRIDPEARTASFGAGLTWNPVLAAAAEHGLAPLLGSAPHVGAVGYSLGGGFGWLARKYGLAVDGIRSMRVVLFDGRLVTTTPAEEPELFWALCGAGGGSLGVVVEMTVALAAVADVYAGNLFYPLDAAPDVFDFYVDWSGGAPEELTSAFNITAFPPLDIVPEPLRGQTFVIVRGCYAGAAVEGAALVAAWRNWRTPLMDMWGPMSFGRCAEISQDPVDPVPAATSGRWLATLDRGVLDAMLGAVVGDQPSPMLFAEARHAGGAIARPNPAVSFAARGAECSLELVGMITGPDADGELERRFEATWRAVAGNLAELPGYLNFTEGQERVQTATQAFGEALWVRLAAAKLAYDPDNHFRHGVPLRTER